MKRALTFILLSAIVLCLSGCSKYNSSYKATILITTNTSKNASMKFSTFIGTKVYKLKCDNDSVLDCSLQLKTGKMKVYYDNDQGKIELASMSNDSNISIKSDKLSKGTIYLIIESDGKCEDGELSFKIV